MAPNIILRVPEDLWPSRKDWTAVVVEIHKKPGDHVEPGEPVVSVELEKAVVSVESPVGGVVVEIHVKEGMKVSPGDPVATIKPQGV